MNDNEDKISDVEESEDVNGVVAAVSIFVVLIFMLGALGGAFYAFAHWTTNTIIVAGTLFVLGIAFLIGVSAGQKNSE